MPSHFERGRDHGRLTFPGPPAPRHQEGERTGVLVGPDRIRQGLLLDRKHRSQAHSVVATNGGGLKELDEPLQPAPRVLFRGVELSKVSGEHLPFIFPALPGRRFRLGSRSSLPSFPSVQGLFAPGRISLEIPSTSLTSLPPTQSRPRFFGQDPKVYRVASAQQPQRGPGRCLFLQALLRLPQPEIGLLGIAAPVMSQPGPATSPTQSRDSPGPIPAAARSPLKVRRASVKRGPHGSFVLTFTITNMTKITLNGPIALVFQSLPQGFTLSNATGSDQASSHIDVLAIGRSLAKGKHLNVNVLFSGIGSKRSMKQFELLEPFAVLQGI